MLDHEAIYNDQDHESTLTEIMHLVDMEYGVTSAGWNREMARLFAIDIVMTVARRNLITFTEIDRQALIRQLQEARALAVAGRDAELGFIQASMESHLSLVGPGRQRRVWLIAMDALIPCPYRAALVSTKSALALDTAGALTSFSDLLRERLLARLGEGSLLPEAPDFLSA